MFENLSVVSASPPIKRHGDVALTSPAPKRLALDPDFDSLQAPAQSSPKPIARISDQGRQRMGSGIVVKQSAHVSSLRLAYQDHDKEANSHPPDAAAGASQKSLKAFPSIGEDELRRLQSGLVVDSAKVDPGDSWINDNIIEEFSKLLAFSHPAFTTISGLLPFENEPTHPAITKALLDPRTGKHIDNLIVCVNPGQSHWVITLFNIPKHSVLVLDSLQSSATASQSVETLIGRIKSLLPREIHKSPIKHVKCPRQTDGYNCGIFALAYLWYLVGSKSMPENLDVELWRRLFLALAEQTTLLSTLPNDVKGANHNVQSPASFTEQEPNDQVMGNTLDEAERLTRKADLIAQQAKLLSKACHAEYSKREVEAGRVLEWLRTEVGPLSSTLSTSAATEATRLTQVLAGIDEEIAKCEQAVTNLDTCRYAASTTLLAQAKAAVKELVATKEGQALRLAKAHVATRVFAGLDIDGAERYVELSAKCYQGLVSRAKRHLKP